VLAELALQVGRDPGAHAGLCLRGDPRPVVLHPLGVLNGLPPQVRETPFAAGAGWPPERKVGCRTRACSSFAPEVSDWGTVQFWHRCRWQWALSFLRFCLKKLDKVNTKLDIRLVFCGKNANFLRGEGKWLRATSRYSITPTMVLHCR
jgi:hypothetical protein